MSIAEATRAKMSLTRLGRRHSPETRAKMSASAMGRTFSAETRARMSEAKLGKPGRRLSDAECEALRAVNTGRHPSEETRAKMRAAKLGTVGHWAGKKRGPQSEACKKKLHDAMYGRPAHYPRKRTYYGGAAFRSTWEARAAKAFDALGIKWEFESKRFDLGSQTYCPDFYLPDDDAYWEIKGYYGPKSQKTITLFREKYPEVPLVLATEPTLLALERAAVCGVTG